MPDVVRTVRATDSGSQTRTDAALKGWLETRGAGAGRLAIDFPLDDVRALVVTHVHIDHVGRIPYLLDARFAGPIVCTEASVVLLPMVLEDLLKVGFTRDERLVARVPGRLRAQTVALPYGHWAREARRKLGRKSDGHLAAPR